MRTAKSIAGDLFRAFIADGLFNVSCYSPADAGDALAPASSMRDSASWARADGDFANMSVQAIGYEEGQNGAVYVYSSKGGEKALEKIDKEKDGVPIRLRRLSPISINPETSQKITNSPKVFIFDDNTTSGLKLACGSSCAPSNATFAGTMGALLEMPGDDDALYILSNNHVIGGCNHAPCDSIIMAPAPADSIIGVAPREVGRLKKICPMSSGHPDFMETCKIDAALAKVTQPEILTSRQGATADWYDTPAVAMPLQTRMQVKKVGRTTGLTYGVVESKIVGYMKLPYKAVGFNATVYFSDFWIVEGNGGNPFALAGDSGSLVVTADESAAVGLVFAVEGGGRRACVLPLVPILEKFGGARLVSQYGFPVTTGESSSTPEVSKSS